MSAETLQEGWVPTTEFGTRLLLARKHAGLTVREAAARSNIHYATWSTWERGARPADMAAEVQKISQALGVDRAWLMWGSVLPRLDSNQQPAGRLLAQVTPRFRVAERYDALAPVAGRPELVGPVVSLDERRRGLRPVRVRTRSGTGMITSAQVSAERAA